MRDDDASSEGERRGIGFAGYIAARALKWMSADEDLSRVVEQHIPIGCPAWDIVHFFVDDMEVCAEDATQDCWLPDKV